MVAPTTPILDYFSKAAGPLDPVYWLADPDSTCGLSYDGLGHAVNSACPGFGAGSMWIANTFGPCCEGYLTITTRPSDGGGMSLLLCYEPVNYYLYDFSLNRDDGGGGDFFELGEMTPSGGAVSPAVPFDWQDGDAFWVRILTDAIRIYQKHSGGDWIPLYTYVRSFAPLSGYLAISSVPDAVIGDFGGGDIECAPPPAPPYGVPPVRTSSFYQQTGLSIIATDPILAANRSTWFSRLADQIQTFRMEKRRIGGYWSADANINMRSDEVEDWIERGLGRHIQIVDEALCQVGEFFVNRIEAKLGKLTFTLGPLTDIANRVQVDYSTIDNSVSPPILGIPASTTPVNDLSSQAIYGIIQKILSTGGSTPTEAAQVGNTYLAEHAWPPTGRQSTLLGGAAGDLTIEMLGYWAWLATYAYNQTAATGSVNASVKLQAVLAAQPNANLFSTDYARITANTVQVSQWEDEDRTGEDVVKAINALGTTTYATTNIGFYNGRQMVYGPAPTSIRYVQRVTGNDLLTDLIGGRVQPWNVMPGEWIFYADFLTGRLPPVTGTAIQRDPRCGLIEVVTLDNRYGLDINGVHVGKLDQMLARQGLAGVGA